MSTKIDEFFGQRLRELRKVSGLTQQQVADEMTASGCLVHRSTIAKIEAGERVTSIGEAAALAAVLGTSLDALVSGSGHDAARSGDRVRALDRVLRQRIAAQILSGCDDG